MNTIDNWIKKIAGALLTILRTVVGGLILSILLSKILNEVWHFTTAFITSIVVVGVGALLALLAVRRIAHRPNQYDSSLPSLGWYAMATVSGVLTAFCTLIMQSKHEKNYVSFLVLGLLFASWCWFAGRTSHSRLANPTRAESIMPWARSITRSGSIRLFTVRGTEAWIHPSLLVGGLLAIAVGGSSGGNVVYYYLGYLLLIAIHECGHVVAAANFGLKIRSVDLSALGGFCVIQAPRRTRDGVIVYSAGMAAQTLVLVATLTYTYVFGSPTSNVGAAFYTIFTVINAILFTFNLLPRMSMKEPASDGEMLWKLFKHKYRDGSHPYLPPTLLPADKAPVLAPETSLLTITELIPQSFTKGLEILNDHTTPMHFVVQCLTQHLKLDEGEAIRTMAKIHNTGGILIPTETFAEAQRIATLIAEDSKANGHSFVCRPVSRAALD